MNGLTVALCAVLIGLVAFVASWASEDARRRTAQAERAYRRALEVERADRELWAAIASIPDVEQRRGAAPHMRRGSTPLLDGRAGAHIVRPRTVTLPPLPGAVSTRMSGPSARGL